VIRGEIALLGVHTRAAAQPPGAMHADHLSTV